jgi:predicted secreted protein
MKLRLVIIGMMAALALSLLACSAGTQEKSLEVSIDDLTSQKNISQQIEVPVGGSLKVTLGSNPTTGFAWSENATDLSAFMAIKQVSHEYITPDGKALGAAGKEVWTFQALNKGTAMISVEYSRPWEGGEKAEWTYKLTVTVK